jgi:hypothetical protein
MAAFTEVETQRLRKCLRWCTSNYTVERGTVGEVACQWDVVLPRVHLRVPETAAPNSCTYAVTVRTALRQSRPWALHCGVTLYRESISALLYVVSMLNYDVAIFHFTCTLHHVCVARHNLKNRSTASSSCCSAVALHVVRCMHAVPELVVWRVLF